MISKNQMLRKQTQNKAKQTQNKPNHKNAKNERNLCYNKELRRKSAAHPQKNEPKTNPIFQCRTSTVVIQMELMRVWPQGQRFDFFFTLPLDPRFDKVFGKYAAGKEKLVVGL